MGELRISDLVDPRTMTEIKDLSEELNGLKDKYAITAKELAKGLKLNVSVAGDLDKLNALINSKTNEASATTKQLNDKLKEQAEIIAKLQKTMRDRLETEKNTTNTISRELAEQEKLNAQKREEFNETTKWKKLADDVLGTHEANIQRLAKIEQELKSVSAATKNLDKMEQSGQITAEEYTKRRSAQIEQERTLKTAKSELTNILANEEKATQSAEGSYQRLSLELERMKKAYKTLTEEEKSSPQGKALAQSIQSYDARLKDLSADMGEFQRNVGNYAIAGQSLKSQLKGMISEIAELEIKWESMSDAEKSSAEGIEMKAHMEELTKKASKLKDTLGDVKESVSHGADDTAAFQGITEGINLIVSGFGAATGAAQLFGMSEEDLVQVQTDLQSALVLSNGLTQIQASIQKQSYVMKGISAIQTKALTLAENLETAAKGKGIIATIALTAAQRVCNAVAKANPYVLLASILLGVVAAVIGLTGANKEEAKSEEEAQKKAEERKKMQEDFANSVASSAGAQISSLMKLRKSWDQLGNNIKAKKQFILENKKAFNDLGYSVNSVSDAEKLLVNGTSSVVKAIILRAKAAAYQTAISKTYENMINKQIQAEQVTKRKLTPSKVGDMISDERAKQLGSNAERYSVVVLGNRHSETVSGYRIKNEAGAKENDRINNVEQYRNRLNLQNQAQDEANRQIIELTAGLQDVNKELGNIESSLGVGLFSGDSSKATSTRKDSSSSNNNSLKTEKELQAELLKIQENTIKSKLQNAEQGSSEELELSKQLADKQYELSKIESENEKDKKLADLESSYSSGAVKTEEYESIKSDIVKQYADYEEQLENTKNRSITDAKEKYAQAQTEIISKQYAESQSKIDAQYTADTNALEKNYAKKLISDEEYQRQKEELDNEYAVKSAQNAVDSLQLQLNNTELSASDRTRLQEELNKAQAELAQKGADAEIAQIKRVTDADSAAKEKRLNNAQQWLDISSQAISAIGELAGAIFDGQLQQLEEESDAKDEAASKEEERITDLVDQNVITEEEGEARKRAAKARTEAENEELEKKKQQIQYKQAVWGKASQIAQTGIATARGIMETIAKLGMPAALPFVAMTAAMGAVQLATILATPIPKYAKGTDDGGHKGGMAIVGDGGKRELVSFDGKMWLTPNTPTLVDMPKGAIVYPDASVLSAELALNPLSYSTNRGSVNSPVIVNNDYTNLERGIGRVEQVLSKQLKYQRSADYAQIYERYKATRI